MLPSAAMTASTDYLTLVVEGLGPSPSLQDVANALVPEAVDLVQIFVRENQELHLAAFCHINPEQDPILEELGRVHRPALDHPTDPVAFILRTGEARLVRWIRRENVERATSDTRVHAIFDAIQPRNIVLVPLERCGDRYGVLVAALATSGRQFIDGDLEFMQRFAQRVGPLVAR